MRCPHCKKRIVIDHTPRVHLKLKHGLACGMWGSGARTRQSTTKIKEITCRSCLHGWKTGYILESEIVEASARRGRKE